MPDRDHATDFWKDVATTLHDTAASVVFDPFNEPWPDDNQDSEAAWTCWRDGGTCAGVTFQVAGMQELVTAIRGTGAKNLILLGGVRWAAMLSRGRRTRRPIQWATLRPPGTPTRTAPAGPARAGTRRSRRPRRPYP